MCAAILAHMKDFSAQQALLGLERSTLPVEEQLDNSIEILGLSTGGLDESEVSEYVVKEVPSNTFAPKEEWILRWLLKRIRSTSKTEPKYVYQHFLVFTAKAALRYSLSHKTWTLLNHAISKLPPKSLGRILKENDFLGTFDTALTEIFAAYNVSDRWLQHLKEVESDERSSKGLNTPHRRSLKRKRSEPEDEPVVAERIVDSPVLLKLKSLLQPILLVLQRCEILGHTGESDGVGSTQHVRIALKGRPELLASILGKAFVAVDAISSRKNDEIWFQNLQDILNIWSLRSEQRSDNIDCESNVEFVRHLLIPSLAFIMQIRRPGHSYGYFASVRSTLERLVAIHVALPLRSAFQNISPEGNIRSVEDDTIRRTIVQFLRPAIQQLTVSETDMLSCMSNLAPILLEIAIRTVPRNNLRARRHENAWLQELFLALSILVGYPIVDSSIDLPEQQPNISSLERLLGTIQASNVTVDDTMLAEIVRRYAGLEEDGSVKWLLLSKLVELEPMMFITSTRGQTSNDLLDMLIGRLSDLSDRGIVKPEERIDTTIQNVVRPLMMAFGRSRDLPVFVELWKRQLLSVFDVGTENEPIRTSLWTDERLIDAFVQIASGNLTTKFVHSTFVSATQCIEGKDTSLGQLCAETLIVDAILLSSSVDSDSGLASLAQAVEGSILANPKAHRYIWRAYRLIHHAYSDLESTNGLATTVKPSKDLLKLVQKTVISALENQESRSSELAMTVFEAFNFIAVCESIFGSDKKHGLEKVLKAFTKFLSSVAGTDDEDWHWDGNGQFSAQGQLAYACLGIVVRFPALLVGSEDVAKSVLETICRVTGDEKQFSIEAQEPLKDYFKALALDDRFTKHGRWTHLVWDVVRDAVGASGKVSTLTADVLLAAPLEAVSRRQKCEMANAVLDILKQIPSLATDQHLKELAVLSRVAESADSSALILSDPRQLWIIAEKCNTSLTAETLDLNALEDLSIKISNRKLATIESKSSSEYLSSLDVICSEYLGKTSSFDYASGCFYICRAFIREMRRVHERIHTILFPDNVHSIQQRFWEILSSDLRAVVGRKKEFETLSTQRKLYIMVESLDACFDICVRSTEGQDLLDKILRRYRKADNLTDLMSASFLKTEQAKLRLAHETGRTHKEDESPSALQITEKYMQSLGPLLEVPQTRLVESARAVQMLISSLASSSLAQIPSMLPTMPETQHSRAAWLLLTTAIVSSPKPAEVEGYTESLTKALHAIATSVNSLTDLPVFVLTSECILSILQNRPEAINQYNFDHILSTIAIATSRSGPDIPDSSARSIIFSRLCRILSTLLSRHRKKLGGRYHLLIPALQGLLTCLFKPPKSRTFPPPKDDFWTLHLPPWTTPSSTPLTTSQTQPFTRLLLVLSDPTPSSVRRSRNNSSALTDETALARRTAGTFLTYFISHYCHLQIQGGVLGAEAKAALMPGIWATLDAMTIEGMRVMNAQMPTSGERSVWKEVYGEWKRIGRWKGD